jgi:hypothetical protein
LENHLMNRRHPGPLRLSSRFVLSAVVAVAVLATAVAPARAQQAPSDAVKTATSIPDPDRQSIAAWVKQQAAQLSDADPAKRTTAKDALLNHANGPQGQPASPTYLDVYANAVTTELAPIAGNKDLPVRLIAGIVAANVAQKADNTQLLPVTLTLLNDKSEAAVYWGIRAARHVLPAVLRNPLLQKNNKLQPAIVAAVKNNLSGALGGPIAAEGYMALTLNLLDPTPRIDPNLKLVIDDMQQLFRLRVDQYKGATPPPEPQAARTPTLFLAHPNVWPIQNQNPKQRLNAIQTMSDLIGLASQHVQGADTHARETLSQLIAQTAKAMWVAAGDFKGSPEQAVAIQKAVEPLMKISPQTPPLEIKSRAETVYPALAAHPDLKGITAPPTIAKKPDAAVPALPGAQATTTRGSQ